MPPSVDRLSGLPDDVICHVLSFLPTSISVSTSILAKRWRFLWAHVPNLYFYENDISDDYKSLDIINRVIALHRAKTINTFHISGEHVYCSGDQMAAWVTHATSRRVRNLHIDLGDCVVQFDDLFTLPRCLLTSETLVDLKISKCRWIPSTTEKVFLPCLKKLNLICITYEEDEYLPLLLSGCPVLEDLTLEGCYSKNLEDGFWDWVFISSPTIKILNVDFSDGRSMLNVNAPSLGYLNVKGCFLEEIIMSVSTTISLVEASFSLLGDWDNDIEKPLNFTGYGTALKLLNSLCKLKFLKISCDNAIKSWQVLKIEGIDSAVKFYNLTKLELLVMIDFHVLVKFLEIADNLEVLTFALGYKRFTYEEPKRVPICVLSHLKVVRIHPYVDLYTHKFQFSANDFEMIKYLLRNALVLERMEIHSEPYLIHSSSKEELEMLVESHGFREDLNHVKLSFVKI